MQPRCQRYRGGLAYERAVDILKRRVDEERLALMALLARVLRYLLLEELCAQADPREPNGQHQQAEGQDRQAEQAPVGRTARVDLPYLSDTSAAVCPAGLKPQRGTQVGMEGANSHL